MTFIPDASVLLAYSLACLVLFITPGPDMSLFLAKTIAGGRRAGIAAMTGTIARLRRAFAAGGLRPLGADRGLALRPSWPSRSSARSTCSGSPSTRCATAPSLNVRTDAASATCRSGARSPLGFSVNLTNPKVVLFFVTFLPQFVDAHDPHAAGKLLFLGIYFVVFAYPLGVLLILGAERRRERPAGAVRACCAPSTGCSPACSAPSPCAS